MRPVRVARCNRITLEVERWYQSMAEAVADNPGTTAQGISRATTGYNHQHRKFRWIRDDTPRARPEKVRCPDCKRMIDAELMWDNQGRRKPYCPDDMRRRNRDRMYRRKLKKCADVLQPEKI